MARYSDKQKAALEALMRDHVYTHAMAIIEDEGLSCLTMERLAQQIGVSRGTIYNYFADRDAVLDYLEDRTFQPLLEETERIAASDASPDAKLAAIIEWVLRSIDEDRALVMAVIPAEREGVRACKKAERQRQVQNAVERVIREGVEQGVFAPLESAVVVQTFLGAISGLIDAMALSGEFLPPDRTIPVVTQILVGGISNDR